jgi:hypothetical protein
VTVRKWLSLRSVIIVARALVCAEFAFGAGVVIYLGGHLFGHVFTGSPPAVPVRVEATCETASGASCHASVIELYKGRYRISTLEPAARLTLNLTPPEEFARARKLLVRPRTPGGVRLDSTSAQAGSITPVRLAAAGGRSVIDLPASPESTSLTFVADPAVDSTPLILDEVGFFLDDRSLLDDARLLFPWIPSSRFYGTLVPAALARLAVFLLVASFIVPGGILRKVNPVLLGLLCLGFCLLDLAILFSPYGAHDLRLFYAAGALQDSPGSNLNIGLWQGFRLLHGEGLTQGQDAVAWSRMPGYGLFCALAGALGGSRTLLDLAIATVLLQVLFYAIALGCFAWAGGLLWPPQAIFTLGLLVAFLPKQLGYTQVDSVIAPIALLVMASLCLRIKAVHQERRSGWWIDVLVHLTFALWFVMRPDVLPGWVVLSLVLHWRQWRRLLVPAALFVAIGCSWGVYKMRYTHEFAMTTSSAGASLFCGLWEVPSRFALTCSDSSYFEWIRHHSSFDPQSKRANDFAVREVLRFWLTFPGHLAVMIDDKLMQCLGGHCWPGLRTSLHEALFYLLVRPPRIIAGLLTIIGLCLAVGHARARTLLLGWPLVLNAPLFWIMFESLGRFYSAIPIALLVAAVPPLFEREFYARLAARPWHTVSVLAAAGVLAVAAWPFHDWLIGADAIHYWTPLLDPSESTLSGFK